MTPHQYNEILLVIATYGWILTALPITKDRLTRIILILASSVLFVVFLVSLALGVGE